MCIPNLTLFLTIYGELFVLVFIIQYITHVHFYKIKKNTLMLIYMHLITLFRIMNPHQ